MKTDIPHMDTQSLPVFDWAHWPGSLDGPKGPGKIYKARLFDSERVMWVHETPCGWQRPISFKFQSLDNPPLTKTTQPCPVGKCGCGEYHYCSACGEQTWIELHGCADGHCTFCHYAG